MIHIYDIISLRSCVYIHTYVCVYVDIVSICFDTNFSTSTVQPRPLVPVLVVCTGTVPVPVLVPSSYYYRDIFFFFKKKKCSFDELL